MNTYTNNDQGKLVTIVKGSDTLVANGKTETRYDFTITDNKNAGKALNNNNILFGVTVVNAGNNAELVKFVRKLIYSNACHNKKFFHGA